MSARHTTIRCESSRASAGEHKRTEKEEVVCRFFWSSKKEGSGKKDQSTHEEESCAQQKEWTQKEERRAQQEESHAQQEESHA